MATPLPLSPEEQPQTASRPTKVPLLQIYLVMAGILVGIALVMALLLALLLQRIRLAELGRENRSLRQQLEHVQAQNRALAQSNHRSRLREWNRIRQEAGSRGMVPLLRMTVLPQPKGPLPQTARRPSLPPPATVPGKAWAFP